MAATALPRRTIRDHDAARSLPNLVRDYLARSKRLSYACTEASTEHLAENRKEVFESEQPAPGHGRIQVLMALGSPEFRCRAVPASTECWGDLRFGGVPLRTRDGLRRTFAARRRRSPGEIVGAERAGDRSQARREIPPRRPHIGPVSERRIPYRGRTPRRRAQLACRAAARLESGRSARGAR